MRVTLDHRVNHLEDRRNEGYTKCGVSMDRDTAVMVYTNDPLNCKRCIPLKWKRGATSGWASMHSHFSNSYRRKHLYLKPRYGNGIVTCATCNMHYQSLHTAQAHCNCHQCPP